MRALSISFLDVLKVQAICIYYNTPKMTTLMPTQDKDYMVSMRQISSTVLLRCPPTKEVIDFFRCSSKPPNLEDKEEDIQKLQS